MPVSFPVATHPAKPYPFAKGTGGCTADETLAMACADQHTKAGEIFQFSLPVESHSTTAGRNIGAKIPNLIPNQNGFVSTLLDAYTQDRALVIRPDDVWLAILSQFNFFVSARAELLRANFLARQMAGLVEKNVVDPTLRAWATPDFTTTTPNDTTVSAVLLMATLKKYFTYRIMLAGCGIPRVTLEGERSDWVNILGRLEKLKEYGLETTAWYHLLRPVISRFVAAFDDPTSPANVDFWQRIAHYQPGGSGRGDEYTGWITAFTIFSKEGHWQGHGLNMTAVAPGHRAPETLSAAEFWAVYKKPDPYAAYTRPDPYRQDELVLDGTPFHRIKRGQVPPGYGEVDVTLDDHGEVFACSMVAGSVGMRVSSSGDVSLSPGGQDDTVRPVVGWWLFVKEEKEMEVKAAQAWSG
ncbi:hypothetical protein B0H13DRAFT_2253138, partial [Mycena leptocephala]